MQETPFLRSGLLFWKVHHPLCSQVDQAILSHPQFLFTHPILWPVAVQDSHPPIRKNA